MMIEFGKETTDDRNFYIALGSFHESEVCDLLALFTRLF